MSDTTSQILSYSDSDLVAREQQNLQKGMNYRSGNRRSVFLMSTRPGAPYKDMWMEKENLLMYEGHDLNAREVKDSKKNTDQPLFEASGSLTDNGKFFKARTIIAWTGDRHFRFRFMRRLPTGFGTTKGALI